MKITRNEKEGKYIIDFEGLEINCAKGLTLEGCSSLWNDDVVLDVRNGVWLFEPKATGRRIND